MHPFSFSRADDPAQAIALHVLDPQLSFIAGGTDLPGLMKDRAIRPERLLDIKGLSEYGAHSSVTRWRPAYRRLRCRSDYQSQNRAQPGYRWDYLGRGASPAGAVGD